MNEKEMKELILNEFKNGKILYPSDIAIKLDIDLKKTVGLIDQLVFEGELEDAYKKDGIQLANSPQTFREKVDEKITINLLKISRLFAMPYIKSIGHSANDVGIFSRMINRDMMVEKHGFGGCETIISFANYLENDFDEKRKNEEK